MHRSSSCDLCDPRACSYGDCEGKFGFQLKMLPGWAGKDIEVLSTSVTESGKILLSTTFGLLVSEDAGTTWHKNSNLPASDNGMLTTSDNGAVQAAIVGTGDSMKLWVS